jgi:ribose transport system substrate-binding protein
MSARAKVLAAAAVAALALAACSSSGGGEPASTSLPATTGAQSSAAAPPATTSSAAADPAAAAAQRVNALLGPVTDLSIDLPKVTGLPDLAGKKILVVPLASVIFSTEVTAIKQALGKIGVTAQVCDGQALPTTIATCLEQAPSIGAVGVITIAIGYKVAPNAYDDLASKNIPVLAAFQSPEGKAVGKYLAFEDSVPTITRTADASADYIIAHSGAAAHVLEIGISDSQPLIDMSDDVHAYLTKNCPECTVEQKNLSTPQVAQATSLVSAQTIADADLNWIFPINLEVTGPAIAQGLQNASKTGTVQQGGAGFGIGTLQLVKQKKASFAVLSSANLIGWEAVDGVLRMIAGLSVPTNYPAAVRIFDASNIDQATLTADAAAGYSWFGQPTYQQTFLGLWPTS